MQCNYGEAEASFGHQQLAALLFGGLHLPLKLASGTDKQLLADAGCCGRENTQRISARTTWIVLDFFKQAKAADVG